MSAFMKLKGGPELSQGIAHLGLPESMIVPLAIVEISCAVIYLIPATAVLGAILLAGFLGGAICTHWRVAATMKHDESLEKAGVPGMQSQSGRRG